MTPEELREWYINDIESKQIVIDDLQAQLSDKEQELKEQIKIHEIVLSRESTNIKLFEEELASLRSENERLKSMKESWEKTADDRKAQIQLKDRVACELNVAFVEQENQIKLLRKRCEDLEAAIKTVCEGSEFMKKIFDKLLSQ